MSRAVAVTFGVGAAVVVALVAWLAGGARAGFGGREEDLPLDVLRSADEVFLTSSTRDVHPVVRADDREWSIAGPISRDLQHAFAERSAARLYLKIRAEKPRGF